MRKISVFMVIFLAMACDSSAVQPDESQTAQAQQPQQVTDNESTPEGPETVADDSEEQAAPAPAGVELTREQLIEQPHMTILQENADPDFSNPQSTEWGDSERSIPDSMTGDPDPVFQLNALSNELGYASELGESYREQTIRLMKDGEDKALGVIARWGFMDDSRIGSDLLVHMERDDGQWYVTSLEERHHCLRGVNGGQCL